MAEGRIVLLSRDDPALAGDDVERLAEYADGTVLARVPGTTTTPTGERAPHGLVLSGVRPKDVETARRTPLPEDDRDLLLAYLELAGPTVPDWLEQLRATGLSLLRFQPTSSYLCSGTGPAFGAARLLPFVVSVTPVTAELKPAPAVPEVGEESVWVVAADVGDVAADLRGLPGVEVVGPADRAAGVLRLPARITAEGRQELLREPLVMALEVRRDAVPEDEVADLVVAGRLDVRGRPTGRYLEWLEDHGVNGRGVAIGIVDNGVDETHPAFDGRITAKDPGREWHGTFVAGHAAGDYRDEADPDGFLYGVGIAPAAGLLSQDNGTSRGASAVCAETVDSTAPDGTAPSIQNNSWGVGTADPMDYGSLEAAYDALVRDANGRGTPLLVCFSAGNSGAQGLTRPKAAKNVLVTGNSENYRPSVGGTDADDVNHLYTGSGASSHGNCADGRIRPHVVAPGEWTASANYDSQPGDAEYISPLLTWGGGTSGASPKTAGACALLTQWWRDRTGEDPSPALLRAIVVNSAVDTGSGGPVPNVRQGWGRLCLERALDVERHTTYVDQSLELTARGQVLTWRTVPSDRTADVRITLAWTDPPGAVGSGTARVPAVVNRLGLRVRTADRLYYANAFAGGWSKASSSTASPPSDEGDDNTACVYLRASDVGSTLEVDVVGLNITTDHTTGRPDTPRQDFALVMSNLRPDEDVTPVDVVILLDRDASSGPPHDGHWDDGGSDDDELGAPWWDAHDQPVRPVLRRGDRGSAVTELQRLLTRAGHAVAADGDFGSGTDAAVRAFQRERGLVVDGVVGAGTWAALDDAAGPPAPDDPPAGQGDWWDAVGPAPAEPAPLDRPLLRRGSRGEHVRALQTRLQALGYAVAVVDGDFGPGTHAAVRAFQQDHGLEADGVVGQATWSALDRAAADAHGTAGGDPWWEAARRPSSEVSRGAAEAEAVLSAARDAVALAGAPARAVDPVDGAPVSESGGGPSRGALATALEAAATRPVDPGRRDAAVVVVGAGTRTGRPALRRLRALASRGGLWLVSDDAGVLDWLVQRLHLRRGVHVRLAAPGGLARAAAAAAAEAAGATELLLRTGSEQGATTVEWSVSGHDTRVVVRLPGAAGRTVRLTPPGAAPRELGDGEAGPVRRSDLPDGTLELALDRPEEGSWSGRWRVALAGTTDPYGWAWGRLDLEVVEPGAGPATEAGPATVSVRASGGTSVLRIRLAATGGAVPESGQSGAVVRARRSRLQVLAEGRAPESAQTVTAPQLSAPLPEGAPTPARPGAVDVAVDVAAVDDAGVRVDRRLHRTVVRLQPRSRWRRSRDRSRQETLVAATARALRYDAYGRVVAVLLREDGPAGRSRCVLVQDEPLRERLRALDLAGGHLLWGVAADRLVAVLCPLDDGR